MNLNKKNHLILSKKKFFLNWQDVLLKTNIFIGPHKKRLQRSNYFFLDFFRLKNSILNLYLVSFNIKKFFNFLKLFSYKYFKFQCFFLCVRNPIFFVQYQNLLFSSFFYLIDLNRNVGSLNQFLNKIVLKPRFVLYFADKHGSSLLKFYQKLGVPIYSFNSFFNKGDFFSYNMPFNSNYKFLYSFFFFLLFLFLKKDRFIYFFRSSPK